MPVLMLHLCRKIEPCEGYADMKLLRVEISTQIISWNLLTVRKGWMSDAYSE